MMICNQHPNLSISSKMPKIFRLFHFLCAFLHLGWQLLRHRWFFQRHFQANFQKILTQSDGSFTEQHLKRMTYYALTAPVLCCEMYANIGKLDAAKRQLMTQLAALSPLFDDFFDELHLDNTLLLKMMRHPFLYEGKNTYEKMVIDLLRKIEPQVRDKPYFFEVAEAIFQAQLDSTTWIDTRDACFRKGGYSTLLFPAALKNTLKSEEKNTFFEYGAMMQWMDDTFDLYEDSKAGFRTLATNISDFREIKMAYTARLTALKAKILEFQPKSEALLFWYKAFIFLSLGFVCIEQLIALQKKIGFQTLSAQNNERKLLICDMEKRKNITIWLKHIWKLI
jgi:hypothetical protein